MDQELKELLEQNLRLNQENQEKLNKVIEYIRWQKIVFYLKLSVFIVPLIAAAMYLPPLLGNIAGVFSAYGELLK